MRFALLSFCLYVSFASFAQSEVTKPPVINYLDTLNKGRLIGVTVGAFAITAATFVGLNELWYKNYPRNKIHSFDDSGEWQGVDKHAHTFAAYHIGVIGYNSLRWSGVKEKNAVWLGGTWGLAFLTLVEVLDGHSAQWGFSWSDMAANTIGTGLLISQQLIWKEQRIVPKFSFHYTEFAQYRPNLLGSSPSEQIMKDYNGQTYWYSLNIASFLKEESKFPKWLSVSGGYGATGMIGGMNNPTHDSDGNALPSFDRYSQYYLSLDIDLHRIKTKSKFANVLLTSLGWIKFPMPALEFNKNGLVFHPVYF